MKNNGHTRGTSFDPAEMARRRVAAGYTQRAVAEHLGISGQAVGAWEDGRNVPSQRHYDMLVKLYETPTGRTAPFKPGPRMKPIFQEPAPDTTPLLREVVMYLRAVKDGLPQDHIARHEKSLRVEIERAMKGLSDEDRAALEAWL